MRELFDFNLNIKDRIKQNIKDISEGQFDFFDDATSEVFKNKSDTIKNNQEKSSDLSEMLSDHFINDSNSINI